jgi:hypothetical protein
VNAQAVKKKEHTGNGIAKANSSRKEGTTAIYLTL